MATEQKPNTEKPKHASPADIGKATTEVAGLLAGFSADEQARIIRAAAAINGLNTGSKR